MMRIEEGGKHSFWADSLPAGLSIVRPFDTWAIVLWLLALAACVAAIVIYGIMEAFLSLPFAAVGFIYTLYRKNIVAIVLIAVFTIAVYLVTREITYILIILFIAFGAGGVACVVDALQRFVFYKVLYSVRYVNVKEKPALRDRIIAFIFSIPPDLDTRNIQVDMNQVGKKFPWKDLWSTVALSMMIGMFFWIYVSLNPAFVDISNESTYSITESSLFVFTIMLYVPVVVMPFSIFRSMNARIGTNFRDFKIYNGVVSTIQRMAVPVFAALVFVFMAIGTSKDTGAVVMFIGMSAAMIFAVILLTSLIYYYSMEATTVSDVSKKWKLFMPVPLLVSLRDDDARAETYPGVPARDEGDLSAITVGIKRRKNN
ncbi:hypothetical protein TALC_01307 [Thermoplasmatales archaeon BRNA1]|nr:hypothetical protein TALC_01307 [Thermoplasmatales archaeon BRNA1]